MGKSGRAAIAHFRANDYLIITFREPNIFGSRGYQVQAPTWAISGDQPGTRLQAHLITKRRGVAQLVARTAGGREVAGSSPVTPTT